MMETDRENLPPLKVRETYTQFQVPITGVDCGKKCAPHNPNGVPFCCDICYAIPAAYHQEWEYLKANTNLWHALRGDECPNTSQEALSKLQDETPESMQLLACQGAQHCQREYRALSCRQFPFFPYITNDFRFPGLAYEWAFENTCWVISHLDQVTVAYRQEFIQTFDDLFSLWPQEMENYANHSEDMRTHFLTQQRAIPILRRDGGYSYLNPTTENLQRVSPDQLPCFPPYSIN